MDNLNEQIGKNIIALEEAENIGYVLDICLDDKLKNFTGFVLCDRETESENFISASAIVASNNGNIFIRTVQEVEPYFGKNTNNPFGKIVYDREGVDLGRVIMLEKQGNKIIKIVTTRCELRPQHIYTSGAGCIIFSRSNKVKKRKAPSLKLERLPKVEIMSTDRQEAEEVTIPAKVTARTSMLLNRTATADIFGLNNELILRKGEIITQNKIEKAKKHNKLNNLMFNSK